MWWWKHFLKTFFWVALSSGLAKDNNTREITGQQLLNFLFPISYLLWISIWRNYLKSKPNDVTTISFILETLEYVQMEDFKYLSWIGNSLVGDRPTVRPETERIIFYSRQPVLYIYILYSLNSSAMKSKFILPWQSTFTIIT